MADYLLFSPYPDAVALSDLQGSAPPRREKEMRCFLCPTVLSRYNHDGICSACKKRVIPKIVNEAGTGHPIKHANDRNFVDQTIAAKKTASAKKSS